MRTLLLVVLGGGLVVFLVVRNRGEEPAVNAANADGVMISEEPSSAAAGTKAAGTAAKDAQPSSLHGDQKQHEIPSETVPAAAQAPAAAPAVVEQPAAVPDAPGDERDLARVLAHGPQSVANWLSERPALERSARGQYACALAMALTGRGEAALALGAQLAEKGGISSTELDALKKLVAPNESQPVAASSGAPSALAHAAMIARSVEGARAALALGDYARTVRGFSNALLGELEAPWPAETALLAEWSEALRKAQAQYQWSPRAAWPALEISVQNGDSLIAIRKRALAQSAGLTTCTGLIAKANGLKNEGAIHPGMKLRIPTDLPHVLVDLDARWMLFFLGENVVCSYPVGIGRQGSETPVGTYKVGEKTSEPTWFPPGAAPVPFNDPRNPLGTRWMAWQSEAGVNTSLGFHGTREPSSIGQQGSEGCIRLLNSDVEELFDLLPRGTEVRVQS
jgi:hypothetical protein